MSLQHNAAVTPTPAPFRRRFHFKKANWKALSTNLDTLLCDIDPSPENYLPINNLVNVVDATARKHIPRGCRKNYVPGLTTDPAEQYNELYEQNHFARATIATGDELAQALTVEQRKRWKHLLRKLI